MNSAPIHYSRKSLPEVLKECIQFLWCYFRSPNNIGSMIPSSDNLSKVVAKNIMNPPDALVIEIGAGTGVITKHILEAGVKLENFFVVEYDRNLFKILEKNYKHIDNLYNIDAAKLSSELPSNTIGNVDYIISTVPLLVVGEEKCFEILKEAKKMLKPTGVFIQVTYTPFLPKYVKDYGIRAKRTGTCCTNFPPAFVWRYQL